jgi:hypothetical protein
MKIIKLNSRKYPGHKVIVDDEDFEELSRYNWHPANSHDKKVAYAKGHIDGILIKMHRFILKIHEYDIKNKLIDHKDQNGLNNQKDNLRICDNSKNKQNANKRKVKCSSKYKGVSFNKALCKWQSYIMINQKRFHIGYYNIEEDAALAYNEKAIELFGEFVCLNIIS